MFKKLTILLFLFISYFTSAFSQEKSHFDKLMEKEKLLDIQLNEIEYIHQKFHRLLYSGSYSDKYRALKNGMEVCNVSPEFLNVLNNTFITYENFKSHKDDLMQTEQKLYSMQFKMLENELEYYNLMKVRRAKNDILDSLENHLDTLIRTTLFKFIKVADSTYEQLSGQKRNSNEVTGILKIIQLLKVMDKSNALDAISQFYNFPMEKKETDLIFSSLIVIADSILCQKTDSLLQTMNINDFHPFVVDYLKLKEKFSYSPNVPSLASFDFLENKFAYYSEIIFRKYISNTITLQNCTEIFLKNSTKDVQNNKEKYYIRNQPISNEEVNLFYISQKEFTTFTFDENLDAELKNKIMNYFSIWSGFDVLPPADKTSINEFLQNAFNPLEYKAKFKSNFNIKSDEDILDYLKNNEFYKVSLSQIQQTDKK